MQFEPVPFENGERFQCDQINLKGMTEYINAKHSGLHSSVGRQKKLNNNEFYLRLRFEVLQWQAPDLIEKANSNVRSVE